MFLWGGGLNVSTFLIIIIIIQLFHSQIYEFSGVFKGMSRDDQALRHPCKFRNLAIFYHEKKDFK